LYDKNCSSELTLVIPHGSDGNNVKADSTNVSIKEEPESSSKVEEPKIQDDQTNCDSTKTPLKSNELIIGGKKKKFLLQNQQEFNYNTITKALYRELRIKKFVFKNPIRKKIEIFGKTFCGEFETMIESDHVSAPSVKFFVIEDLEKLEIIINLRLAKLLEKCVETV
jgi:hypothetical protein